MGGTETLVGILSEAIPGSLVLLHSWSGFLRSGNNRLLGDNERDLIVFPDDFNRSVAGGVVGAVRLRLICGSLSEQLVDFSISLCDLFLTYGRDKPGTANDDRNCVINSL